MDEVRTLAQLIERGAAEHPERAAFVYLVDGLDEKESITYRTLLSKAGALAENLLAFDLRGERAILILQTGLSYVISLAACALAGVTAVTAYPPDLNRLARSGPRLEAIARDSRAAIVLTDQMIAAMKNEIVASSPALGQLRWLAVDSVAATSTASAAPSQPPLIQPEDTAVIQYTSGSTGTPRGVVLTHANVIANLADFAEATKTRRGEHIVCWIPLHHDLGLIGHVFHSLFLGGTCFLLSPTTFIQDPYKWLYAISRYGGVFSGAPNFAFDLAVRRVSPAQLDSLDLSSWRCALNGAEPIRVDTLRRFCERFGPAGFSPESLYPAFGLSDATAIVSGRFSPATSPPTMQVDTDQFEQGTVVALEQGQPGGREVVSCGWPVRSTTVAIVDVTKGEEGQAVPANVVGEVWASGPSISHGYFGHSSDEIFKARIRGDSRNWLRTGDLGFLSSTGELYIAGRTKDVIIEDGRKVYPQDIEHLTERQHPGLRPGNGAAVGVEVAGKSATVIIHEFDRRAMADRRAKTKPPEGVERRQGDRRTTGAQHYSDVYDRPLAPSPEDDLERLCTKIFVAAKAEFRVNVVAVVLIVPMSIPKTSSGKIMRSAARDQFLAGTLNQLCCWRPETHLKRRKLPRRAVLEWLSAWLQDEGVSATQMDVQRGFNAYGLDSAGAVRMCVDLSIELGRIVEPIRVWEFGSIGEFASAIASE